MMPRTACLMVSLLLVGSTRAAFPMMGPNPFMANPYTSFGGNPNLQQQQQNQVDPNMLTCISAEAQDVQSQIRLTLKPMQDNNNMMHPMGGGLGLGGMGHMGQDSRMPQNWHVSGFMLPSQAVQKAGSYQVAVFQGGRTYPECKSSALGDVLNTAAANGHLGQMGGLGGFGMSPYSPLGWGMNPAMGMGMGGFQQQPSGMISNNAVLGMGTTVYAGIIKQVSRNDLAGRSIGVCQSISNGRCLGAIAYCCSITRDTLAAEEVFVEPQLQAAGSGSFNPFGAQGINGVGGVGLLSQGGGVLNAVGGSDDNNVIVSGAGGGAIISNGDNGLF